MRCLEDIDLDVSGVARWMLENKVEREEFEPPVGQPRSIADNLHRDRKLSDD